MTDLGKLLGLIREFAEKASVPEIEAAQAIMRAVSWKCMADVFAWAVISFVLVLLGFLNMKWASVYKKDERYKSDYNFKDNADFQGRGGACLMLTGSAIFIIGLAVVVPERMICFMEPLGNTLRNLVLK